MTQIPAHELDAVLTATGAAFGRQDVRTECIVEDPVVSATAGLWRLHAGAWSVVLKVIHAADGASPNWQAGSATDHWFFWEREALAYRSGLLDEIAGPLRAPAVYGVWDRPDGSIAIWMEDLAACRSARDWALSDYRAAAAALGEAQGCWAARPLPDEPWLARQWLRRYVERRAAGMDAVDAHVWDDPLVAAHFDRQVGHAIANVWAQRDELLVAVEAAPQTLCHLDLHPGNLFAGPREIVLIDWAFLGIGAIGEDIGSMIFDTVLDFFVGPDQLGAVAGALIEGYADGLDRSGFAVDADALRRTIRAAAVVKYLWLLPAMLDAVARGRPTLNRRPLRDGFEWWAPAVRMLATFPDIF